MLKVTIESKEYFLRDKWEDNTVEQMEHAQEYLSKLPTVLEQYFYTDKEVNVSEQKLLDFYVDWIELFSDIPREYLESEIEVNSANDVSLVTLFNLVFKFMGEPQDLEPKEEFTFNGDTYKLIEPVKTVGGIEKLLGGATYKHFVEAQALSSLFSKKKYRKWSYLARMTAILFRLDPNEKYDEEVIELRAKAFKKLPVSDVYSAYFFLLEHINKLQGSLVSSLRGKVESQPTQKRKSLLRRCIGKIKPLRLLKRVFSILRGLLR